MFTLPNVFHFLAHELARLGRGRFAFALVFARPFDCFFFWHIKMVSPPIMPLDVAKTVLASVPLLLQSRKAVLPSGVLKTQARKVLKSAGETE